MSGLEAEGASQALLPFPSGVATPSLWVQRDHNPIPKTALLQVGQGEAHIV